jgi:hypothetical protein
VAVELALVDLDRRLAVVRADDDGFPSFPHALRGTLAAMLAVPTWHVIVAFDPASARPFRPPVAAVVDQATRWARERNCRLTVTTRGPTSQHAPVEP